MKTIPFIRWDIYKPVRDDRDAGYQAQGIRQCAGRNDANGLCPTKVITWEDGTHYEIDQIKDVRKAASLKAGGAGIRYRVRIGRTETNLFLEENRWFVEGK